MIKTFTERNQKETNHTFCTTNGFVLLFTLWKSGPIWKTIYWNYESGAFTQINSIDLLHSKPLKKFPYTHAHGLHIWMWYYSVSVKEHLKCNMLLDINVCILQLIRREPYTFQFTAFMCKTDDEMKTIIHLSLPKSYSSYFTFGWVEHVTDTALCMCNLK